MKEQVCENKGRVFNIQKYSIYDGNGIRTLVFLKGCPMRCKWCSNPESLSPQYQIMYVENLCSSCGNCVKVCPVGIHSVNQGVHVVDRSKTCIGCGQCESECPQRALSVAGKEMSVHEVMEIIEQDSFFYWNSGGGVTIGGGEMAMQPSFSLDILKQCKSLGIHTAIETCGIADWNVYEELLDYVDLFLYDVKHMDSAIHKKLTGQGNEKIISNLGGLLDRGAQVTVRMPLVKGYNDSYDALTGALDYVFGISEGKHLKGVEILPYHKLGVNKYKQLGMEYPIDDDPAYSEEELVRLEGFLERYEGLVKVIRH